MSRSFKILLMICVVILQTTVLAHFRIWGVLPNYVFLVLAALAFVSPNEESIVIAGFAGLTVDMLTGAPTGLNTLLSLYGATVCAAVSETVYNRGLKIVCPLCFGMSFLYELLSGVFSMLLREAGFYAEAVLKTVLPTAFLNTVVVVPVYLVLKSLKFEKRRKGIRYERQI